jgi:hypothetical protein
MLESDEQVLEILAELSHDAETMQDKFDELSSFFEYYETYCVQDDKDDYYKWWDENKFDGYSYQANWQSTKPTGGKVTLESLRKGYVQQKEKVTIIR